MTTVISKRRGGKRMFPADVVQQARQAYACGTTQERIWKDLQAQGYDIAFQTVRALLQGKTYQDVN